MPRKIAILAALVLACEAYAPVRAAESYDNCNGTISSLPATISTQGVWCLKSDLSTDIASGAAITVATNNVTIDCNDFKLGGLAAGPSTQAAGIMAILRQNVTVRHCNIRGFLRGIDVRGASTGGHLIEDNRLDGNLQAGIVVTGEHILVRRNNVFGTGGATTPLKTIPAAQIVGIDASGDIIDNIVSGVDGTAASAQAVGIRVYGTGNQTRGNVVRSLKPASGQLVGGIDVDGHYQIVEDNHIAATAASTGRGVAGDGLTDTFCTGNSVANFSLPIDNCKDGGGNSVH
jgi:hypothetical protein